MQSENNKKTLGLVNALKYAARGWAVIPVYGVVDAAKCECGNSRCKTPGKHPRISAWPTEATKDAAQVERWWGAKSNSNVGILAGEISGLLVLDIDPRHGGDASLVTLEEEFGRLPSTLSSSTGGGGKHLFFAYPSGQKIGNKVGLRPGIDIRSNNGFVVAPPSIHASGGIYAWVDEAAPISPMPEWLVKLVTNSSSQGVYGEPGDEIPEGSRNDSLFKLGCSMRAKGANPDSIAAALNATNEKRCRPPLTREEVIQIARSCGSYDAGKENECPYIARDGKTFLLKVDAKGNQHEVLLANFVAHI